MTSTIRVSGTREAIAALQRASDVELRAVGQAVARTAIEGEGRMKRMLSQPGTGRTYLRGGISHTASAPGQPPAVDTGSYRASWHHAVEGIGSAAPSGAVYTADARGPWLEIGTARMAARPHAGPVAVAMAQDFARHTADAVRTATARAAS